MLSEDTKVGSIVLSEDTKVSATVLSEDTKVSSTVLSEDTSVSFTVLNEDASVSSALVFLQLRLEAVDTFYPSNIGSSNVFITVIRNPSSPQYVRASYVQNVPEYQTPGTQLLVVSATDPDGVSYL